MIILSEAVQRSHTPLLRGARREGVEEDVVEPPPVQDAFEWNHYHTGELRELLKPAKNYWFWVQPIIHGSFSQRCFTFFGKDLDLILIARRSRHYAGTRYLKRGISVHGKVANDCETEQIVGLDCGLLSTYASHVQVRVACPCTGPKRLA